MDYPARKSHLVAFGAIVQDFARFERLVELCVSRILKSDHFLTAVVMSGLGYSAKCDVLTGLLEIEAWPDAGRTLKIKEFVKAFNTHLPLRNAIAHHPWMSGIRPDSIKQLSAISRGGKVKLRGVREDEQDYTSNELQ